MLCETDLSCSDVVPSHHAHGTECKGLVDQPAERGRRKQLEEDQPTGKDFQGNITLNTVLSDLPLVHQELSCLPFTIWGESCVLLEVQMDSFVRNWFLKSTERGCLERVIACNGF